MFTLLYLQWDPYKLCRKKKIVFVLKIFYYSLCLTSNKLHWIEDQLANVSTWFYTWRFGIGELNRQRLDCNSMNWLLWRISDSSGRNTSFIKRLPPPPTTKQFKSLPTPINTSELSCSKYDLASKGNQGQVKLLILEYVLLPFERLGTG